MPRGQHLIQITRAARFTWQGDTGWADGNHFPGRMNCLQSIVISMSSGDRPRYDPAFCWVGQGCEVETKFFKVVNRSIGIAARTNQIILNVVEICFPGALAYLVMFTNRMSLYAESFHLTVDRRMILDVKVRADIEFGNSHPKAVTLRLCFLHGSGF
jgi:hypothetical protein